MKTRKGFVSNSSSSSFVCDITGTAESGWDMSLNEVDMVSCSKGHTFCYSGYPEVVKWVETADEEDDDSDTSYGEERAGGYSKNVESNYNMPARLCPICNGDQTARSKIIARLKIQMKDLNVSAADLT